MRPGSLSWARPLYFILYAATAALSPFLVLYYQDLGLDGTQIGVLAGLPALMSLLSGPIWGAFADWTKKKKLTLLVAIGGTILLVLVISKFTTFWLLIPIVALYTFFSSPIFPLVDSSVMAELGGQKQKYGQYRVWGAVGWGLSAPAVGWLIENSTIKTSFWAYAGMMLVGLLIVMRSPVRGNLGSAAAGDFRQFLTDHRWLIFLGIAFIFGMVLSMISSFLFLYMRALGANELTLGWALTMATVSEIPVLYFSNRLLRRWPPLRLMTVALFFFAIRALAYTLFAAPWMSLVIQLLHGPTFSLMWIAGVAYADAIAPAGLHATAQGLFSGVIFGVGSTIGAMLGGVIYEQTGLVFLFRLAAVISMAAVIFLWATESRVHGKTV